ncbi:hypothetical protein CEE45_04435 [Candidatus Heimdallarchaeota archaeon B3_Heim]|nr:MAG: hypothetical protein CEE45_04435 [Candidatus Heimdallarchaeota archaeon B3_Heim]
MSKKDDPLLIFTTKVSRCANGYHLKIRKKDVELLNLAGQMVKIKVYTVGQTEEETTKDPYEKLVD